MEFEKLNFYSFACVVFPLAELCCFEHNLSVKAPMVLIFCERLVHDISHNFGIHLTAQK